MSLVPDLSLGLTAAPAGDSGGSPTPPPGFALVQQDGAFVLDGAGADYVIQEIP